MTDLATIRSLAKWPDEPPGVSPYMHGWFFGQDTLPLFCGAETRLIVELGSWLGKSARWFCNRCRDALVVCIDHWNGSPEFNGDWSWIIPRAYETFLKNLWGLRERIVPLRMTTLEGIELLSERGAAPDLVYIDAGHDEQSVCGDVRACLKAFPGARLVGDDWNWESVQRGVRAATDREIQHNWRFWWL